MLRALARATPYMNIVTPYMNTEKRKLLMNSFFNIQFNYCPYGRYTVVAITIKSNIYMKDV